MCYQCSACVNSFCMMPLMTACQSMMTMRAAVKNRKRRRDKYAGPETKHYSCYTHKIWHVKTSVPCSTPDDVEVKPPVMLVPVLTETAKAKAIARTPPGSVVGSQGGWTDDMWSAGLLSASPQLFSGGVEGISREGKTALLQCDTVFKETSF